MSATPAIKVLTDAGVTHRLRPYQHDPQNHHFGEEAAAALGVDPMQIFKTLVVDCPGGRPPLAVAVVPVAAQLDLRAMAEALGVKRTALADASSATKATGYVTGGISPLGQKVRLPTVVDETAELFETVLVSAGRRGLQVELVASDLVALTDGRFADIAR